MGLPATQLHDYFDGWLDDLQAKLPNPETTLAQITKTMWALRQELTGSLTEAIVDYGHRFELMRQQIACPSCQRLVPTRPLVTRTVETMVGSVRLEPTISSFVEGAIRWAVVGWKRPGKHTDKTYLEPTS